MSDDADPLEHFLLTQVVPHLPGFTWVPCWFGAGPPQPLLYLEPIGEILRGVRFFLEAPSKNAFLTYYVVEPLFTPEPVHDSYPIGFLQEPSCKKLFGEPRFKLDRETQEGTALALVGYITTEGRELLASFAAPSDYAENAHVGGPINEYPDVAEAVAYARFLTGDYEGSRESLKALLAMKNMQMPSQVRDRIREMIVMIAEDPSEVRGRLSTWRTRRLAESGLTSSDTRRGS